jgi:SAM-dependent methyltransferase
MNRREYEVMFRVEETHWWYRTLHRLIEQSLDAHLASWRDRRILDAGCGTGAILERLGNPEAHVGIDLSPDALAYCKQRGLRSLTRGDVTALPFAAGTFDAVISSSVLYHQWVPDVGQALVEARRVLRPGGLLLLNLPAFAFLHSAHDEAVHTARRFRKPEVSRLLEAHGFAVRSLSYWTTLLFPAAVVARTLGGSSVGRDFEAVERPSGAARNRALTALMSLELAWLRRWPLPVGVAIFAVAENTSPQGVRG